MNKKISFLVLVLFSSIIGILLSILNNNIIIDNQEDSKFDKNTIKKNISKEYEEIKDVLNKTQKELNISKKEIEQENQRIEKEKEEIKKKEEEIRKKEEEIRKKEEEIKKQKEEIERREKEYKKKQEEIKKREEEIKKMQEEKKKLEEEEKKSKKSKITLAFNVDNKFIYPCLVLLTSLADNIGPNTEYRIHILHPRSFEQRYIDKINKFVQQCPKNTFNISFHNMQDNFRGATSGSHISITSYYRIALPSMLQNESRVIYMDTDVLNFVDLTEMYNLELKDNIYFRGTLDDPGLINELRPFGLKVDKYMNAGILLVNLQSMRRDGVEKKIRDFVSSHFLDHHDQTAINSVCYNNWEILSFKYAVFRYNKFEDLKGLNDRQDKKYRFSEEELRQAYYNPTLLHFVGWTKPWDRNNNINFAKYWWYYAKKSLFYEEILSRYGFDKSKIEKLIESIPNDGGLLRNYKK